MITPTERDQFEAWCHQDTSKFPDGSYKYYITNSLWKAWQAARASQVAAPPAPPDEPLIDGYPLWSGIPQPAEQAELSDAAESLISYLESLGIENKAMDYLRAVAAAKGRRRD